LNVKDSTGTSWQIGYMDEYAGTDPNPPVLVIIQGRGAFCRPLRQRDEAGAGERHPRHCARR
jgi:hypothetical protein